MSKPLPRMTRQHRSGNDFVVDIPADLAFPDVDQELEIEAVGDTRVIRPIARRPTFDEMFAQLAELRTKGASGLGDDALVRAEWPEHRLPK